MEVGKGSQGIHKDVKTLKPDYNKRLIPSQKVIVVTHQKSFVFRISTHASRDSVIFAGGEQDYYIRPAIRHQS